MTKDSISYQEKLNELRLDVFHPNRNGYVYILVEGDSDIRLFRKFFKMDNCKVEAIPGGKIGVEKSVNELLGLTSLVIGIRDADFLHLTPNLYNKSNIFLTDYHDIEMTLISEDDVMSAILFEYTDIDNSHHIAVRDTILNIINDVSLLKWLNEREDLELSFDVGFQDIIDSHSFSVNFEEYFDRVLSKSPRAKIKDFSVIQGKINVLKTIGVNPYQLSNGHDFMKALSWYIRRNGRSRSVSDDVISSSFRMLYRHEFLNRTILFSNTLRWALSNGCDLYSI